MAGFGAQLKKFEDTSLDKVTTVTRAIALEVFRRVILKTPVDTGRARGNWQCTISVPASSVADVEDKGGGKAIAQAADEVMGWEPEKVVIFLTNNLPYIHRLEDGYSQQAPAGMVAVTLAELDGIVVRVTT